MESYATCHTVCWYDQQLHTYRYNSMAAQFIPPHLLHPLTKVDSPLLEQSLVNFLEPCCLFHSGSDYHSIPSSKNEEKRRLLYSWGFYLLVSSEVTMYNNCHITV